MVTMQRSWKLRGSWALVRTRGGSSARPAWLLIKQRDEFASAEDIVATEPRSVVSNRLMAEIAWQEGGDVEKAASADPPAAVRRLLANSKAARPERRKPPRIDPSDATKEVRVQRRFRH